jgi:hypothetical protein
VDVTAAPAISSYSSGLGVRLGVPEYLKRLLEVSQGLANKPCVVHGLCSSCVELVFVEITL